jgi:hypothetical protein
LSRAFERGHQGGEVIALKQATIKHTSENQTWIRQCERH